MTTQKQQYLARHKYPFAFFFLITIFFAYQLKELVGLLYQNHQAVSAIKQYLNSDEGPRNLLKLKNDALVRSYLTLDEKLSAEEKGRLLYDSLNDFSDAPLRKFLDVTQAHFDPESFSKSINLELAPESIKVLSEKFSNNLTASQKQDLMDCKKKLDDKFEHLEQVKYYFDEVIIQSYSCKH